MDEMTSDYEAQRFTLIQAVSEQVILPSQLKALCLNKMMSDRHGQLPILGLMPRTVTEFPKNFEQLPSELTVK